MSKKIQTIFDQESWKNYSLEIKEFIKKDFEHFYNTAQHSEVVKNVNEAKEAYDNYKKKFNWALYYTLIVFSPILVLLIIPAYWVIKKIISLNKSKNELKAKFEKENRERLDLLKSSVRKINFYKIIEQSLHHIGYKWQGPIPSYFVDTINKYVVFKSDYVSNSENKNNYISSWGTFNDQLVVLNLSTKIHKMIMKQYSASITISSGGSTFGTNTSSTTETLTAYYDHPFPQYDIHYIVSVFSSACEGLNFKLTNYKYKPLFYKQDNENYIPFENKIFDKSFKISRNNEAQIRMVYTADLQEYLVHQRELNKDRLPSYLRYYKSGSLFSSDFLVRNPFYNKTSFNSSILNDIDMDFEKVLEKCSQIILDIVYQRFLSLNFVTSIPLLMTQFDTNLIKELNNLYKITEITPEDCAYAQYVFNAIWENEILKCDTQIMNCFEIKSKKIVSNNLVVAAQFTAFGYNGTQKIMPVSVMSSTLTCRTIDVPYIDYSSVNKSAMFYYARINTANFYIRGNTDFTQEIVDAIKNSGLADQIIIKNRHIALVDFEGNLYSKFENLLWYFTQDEKNDDLLKNLIDFS